MIKKILSLSAMLMICLSLCSCDVFRTVETEKVMQETAPYETIETSPVTETVPETTVAPETGPTPVIPTRDPSAPPTICIDAGHGYVDPGCSTDYINGLNESDIVSEYADVLKAALEDMGYRVILLRDNDKYVTAEEISAAADKMGMTYLKDKLVDDRRFAPYNRAVWANVIHRETYIDLFISLHIDSYDAMESVRGTRVYYCSENNYSADSQNLCASVVGAIDSALPSQGTRVYPVPYKDAFVVTKHTEMPSMLIEMGFATNKTDAENIIDEEWRLAFTSAVAEGIKNFVEGYVK